MKTDDVTDQTPSSQLGSLQVQIAMLREETEKNQHLLRSIRRHMMLSSFMSVLQILVLVVPVVWAVIYLPPLIQQAMQTMQKATNSPGGLLQSGVDLTPIEKLLHY